MLHEFIDRHRDDIVARTTDRGRDRTSPSVSSPDAEHGVPLFLTQLSETLRLEATATPVRGDAIGSTATRHGAELVAAGFNVSQVVHDYGDICQAITEIALEQRAPITVDEFHTLNRCLDVAIAEAVTEHARLIAQQRSLEEIERLGHAAHELRDLLNGALLALHALKRESVAMSESAGAVLDRSLAGLAALVDRTLSEVRLANARHRQELVCVATFVDEIAETGMLHAEYRGIRFQVTPVDPALVLQADPQLLASAVMNLLHNAFKYTHAGGAVILRVHAEGQRLSFEIEDQCGGIPEAGEELFRAFGNRRGIDRSGLGLGLSIARQAVRAHDGDITIRNKPGDGCIFTIGVPLTARDASVPVHAATHTLSSR